MKNYKVQNFSMLKLQKANAGFTLIELLLVISIIAILSTIILISLNSGREKAELGRYISYAVQMQHLVADSVTAGQFDSNKISITHSDEGYCLGEPGYNCGQIRLSSSGTGDSAEIYRALTYLATLPKTTDENSLSPYSSGGVYMIYKSYNNVIRVVMAVGTDDDAFVDRICNSMKWKRTGYDCYIDIPLHSRL